MNPEIEKYAQRMSAAKVREIMPRRMAHIMAGLPVPPRLDYAANVTAAALHPKEQYLLVSEVIEREGGARSFVLVPDTENGTASLAPFCPGHFLNFKLKIGDSTIARDYSICCPASWAGAGKYMITVKPSADGFAGNWICENWKAGTPVLASAPLGEFTYSRLRDSSNIVGVCGGSGVTPFYSMAASIAEGSLNARLTLIYGSRSREDAMLIGELEKLADTCDKFKLVSVIGDPISADIIKAAAPEGDYSLFVCGPLGMLKYLETQIPLLGLPGRRIRKKTVGVTSAALEEGWDSALAGKVFDLTVNLRDKSVTVPCAAEESILVAMERAGLNPPSHCRSGECGWCRSRLVSGQVFMPERSDFRRLADLEYGYIHPCCTFAVSDLTISVMCE